MSDEVQVISLGPDDWARWRLLRRRALADSPEVFGSTLADWSGPGDVEQRWRDRLTWAPLNIVLGADGADLGMVSATEPGADGRIQLISLWVTPEARGRGLGELALCTVIEHAAQQDRGVSLVVRTVNVRAQRLYRRHGFVDAGVSAEDPAERVFVRP